jgi:hypothetical protein
MQIRSGASPHAAGRNRLCEREIRSHRFSIPGLEYGPALDPWRHTFRLYRQALQAGSTGRLYRQALQAGSTGRLYRQALQAGSTGRLYRDEFTVIGSRLLTPLGRTARSGLPRAVFVVGVHRPFTTVSQPVILSRVIGAIQDGGTLQPSHARG